MVRSVFNGVRIGSRLVYLSFENNYTQGFLLLCLCLYSLSALNRFALPFFPSDFFSIRSTCLLSSFTGRPREGDAKVVM
jgi:hypothetical protein